MTFNIKPFTPREDRVYRRIKRRLTGFCTLGLCGLLAGCTITPASKHAPSVQARVVPATYARTLAFDLPEQVNALGIDETTDFVTWQTVYQETPGLWIGAGPKQVTFYSNHEQAFYRAWVRNEP